VVINLLRHFPLVIITKEGSISGIITKSDVIKVLG
jgi:predicted transcriptional regulator